MQSYHSFEKKCKHNTRYTCRDTSLAVGESRRESSGESRSEFSQSIFRISAGDFQDFRIGGWRKSQVRLVKVADRRLAKFAEEVGESRIV